MVQELNKYFPNVFTQESDNIPSAQHGDIAVEMPKIVVTRED
jgi:hypothetical protein